MRNRKGVSACTRFARRFHVACITADDSTRTSATAVTRETLSESALSQSRTVGGHRSLRRDGLLDDLDAGSDRAERRPGIREERERALRRVDLAARLERRGVVAQELVERGDVSVG